MLAGCKVGIQGYHIWISYTNVIRRIPSGAQVVATSGDTFFRLSLLTSASLEARARGKVSRLNGCSCFRLTVKVMFRHDGIY